MTLQLLSGLVRTRGIGEPFGPPGFYRVHGPFKP